jgi:hypothetical protein
LNYLKVLRCPVLLKQLHGASFILYKCQISEEEENRREGELFFLAIFRGCSLFKQPDNLSRPEQLNKELVSPQLLPPLVPALSLKGILLQSRIQLRPGVAPGWGVVGSP